jgi:hypothetical protein
MLRNVRRVAAGLAAAALVVAGLASASSTHKVSATLNAKQEIPKQHFKVTKAKGSFTGTMVKRGGRTMLTWKLTYSGLSGKATAAHIHAGKRGSAGIVLIPLCASRCHSGLKGTSIFNSSIGNQIERGATYVNVHTSKNPAGEIRGQVKVVDR